jgi:hypothetical protein
VAGTDRKGLGKDAATKNRVVRVTDDIWEAAKAAAAERGETVSDVVRRALIDYADLPKETPGVVGRRDRQ